MNLKSPIKDVNKCLNDINKCFNFLYSIFSPGSRVVDHFSSRITFYSPPSLSDDNFHHHLQKLNYAFNLSQILSHSTTVISNSSIKKSHVASVAVMNIEWNYSYYQPWSDNEWLVDEMIAM